MMLKKLLLSLSLILVLPISSIKAGNSFGKPAKEKNEKTQLVAPRLKRYDTIKTEEEKAVNAEARKQKILADYECTMRHLSEGGFNLGRKPEENNPQ